MEIISGSTQVFGIIGDPVEHSLSPKMHNAAFKALNLNNIYVPFGVCSENLGEAIKGIRSLGIKGVNVTTPHKEALLPYLDELSEDCRIIGAVNTVKNDQGKLTGYNTDGAGFVRYLKEELGVELKGQKAVIIGIGGAAKSISLYLCREGLEKIIIANRNPEKAEEFAALLRGETNIISAGVPLESKIINSFIKKCSLLIYAVPTDVILGKGWPFNPDLFPPGLLVVDLRYFPRETALMKASRGRGLQSHNGLGMLLYQGILAFKIFTGKEPPVEIMKASLPF